MLVASRRRRAESADTGVRFDMSGTVLELYLSKGCICSGDSYVQRADDGTHLFTLSHTPCCTGGIDRVLRDDHSAPLLRAKTKGWSFRWIIAVYKGESKEANNLVFSVKFSSIFSRNLHIFLAGSSLDGPPDYKLKPATLRNSLKIFRQGKVVAKAKKYFILCGGCCQPDYTITISPGMDQAMVVLLVAIHEDLRPKSKGGGGGGGGGH